MNVTEFSEKVNSNWKYIALFIIIAFGISTPIHLGYIDETYKDITRDWIITNWIYLAAGFGPFIAGLVTLFLQKNISSRITIWGQAKNKNMLIALLPVISFSITGLENSYGINMHYYGFIYAFINVLYAFLEEFGWRRYLQNALAGVSKNWKYILIGIIWWLWHQRFETSFDIFIFPIICIGGGLLLGKLTDDTRSIIPTVMFHALIILLTNSGVISTHKIMGVVLTVIGWLFIETIWRKRVRVSDS